MINQYLFRSWPSLRPFTRGNVQARNINRFDPQGDDALDARYIISTGSHLNRMTGETLEIRFNVRTLSIMQIS